MRYTRKKLALLTVGVGLLPAMLLVRAHGSDHADTPAIAAAPGADLTDVYMFPSPNNSNNVVLSMSVHPLIGSGQGPAASFDPNVLYQFKIDNVGDSVEHLVIQAKFSGTGPTQTVAIAGPAKPNATGTAATLLTPYSTKGVINTTFSPTAGMQVFAGAREDSFFFDLEQFFTILPDRGSTIPPPAGRVEPANPNQPMATTWNNPGTDFLSANKFNVLSIVIELPKSMLLAK